MSSTTALLKGDINIPDVPTPTGDAHSDEQHQKLVALDRMIKLRILFVAAFCLPFLSYICYFIFNLDAAQTMAALTSFGHFTYFLSLILSLYRAKYIYRVQPRYRILPEWAQMTLPIHMDQYPEYPIFSISEFSSIRGSLSNLFLFGVGLFTLTSYLSLFIQNESKWNISIGDRSAAILSFGAGIGLTWIGIFELNPNDLFHQIMHYVGVCICSLSSIGFCIHQNWSTYSIVLFYGLLLFFVIWQCLCHIFAKRGKFDDINQVTKVSILCISMEMILLAFGTLSFDSYLFSFK